MDVVGAGGGEEGGMPIIAQAPDPAVQSGNTACATDPNTPPSIAPM